MLFCLRCLHLCCFFSCFFFYKPASSSLIFSDWVWDWNVWSGLVIWHLPWSKQTVAPTLSTSVSTFLPTLNSQSLPVRKQVGNREERKRAGGKTNFMQTVTTVRDPPPIHISYRNSVASHSVHEAVTDHMWITDSILTAYNLSVSCSFDDYQNELC